MFKTERDFQNALIKRWKSYKDPNLWRYKIPDVNMQIKPFDIIVCAAGKSHAYELKICDLKKGLTYEQAFKMLRPNQVGALASFQIAGGKSFIKVYNKAEDKEYTFEFRMLDGIDTGEL